MLVLDPSLYTYMLDMHAGALECSYATTDGWGRLDEFWTPCENEVCWFLQEYRDDFSWEEEKIVKFLVLIHYLTYIPYGIKGYQKMQELLSVCTKGGKRFATVPEFRFEWLKSGAGKRISRLPQEQLDVICDYYKRFEKDKYDMADLLDVVCLFCRMHQQAEALYGKEGMQYSSDLYACMENVQLVGEGSVVTVQDIFDQIEEMGPIGKKEISFLKKTTGLVQPRVRKEG